MLHREAEVWIGVIRDPGIIHEGSDANRVGLCRYYLQVEHEFHMFRDGPGASAGFFSMAT
jgi:hypothetical protein